MAKKQKKTRRETLADRIKRNRERQPEQCFSETEAQIILDAAAIKRAIHTDAPTREKLAGK